MEKTIKNKLTTEEINELDDILNKYYSLIKGFLIEKKKYTTNMVAMASIEFLNRLFNSITGFKVLESQSIMEKDIQADDISKKEIKNIKIKQIYELLKEYYLFVVKVLKKYGNINKNNTNKLAKDWLMDFIKIEAYNESLINN